MRSVLLARICNASASEGTYCRRQQVIRLERELAAAKAAAEFNNVSANGDEEGNELQERFVEYESKLSAANKKIAECNILTFPFSN